MKRINNTHQDKRIFECPQCHKRRMRRPLDHIVNQEMQVYKTKRGQEISLHIDICDFCRQRNYRYYFEPTKTDIKKVLKAMHDETIVDEETSLEDLL